MKQYFFLILILLGMTINVAGCWDQIELDKRAVIMALGIDSAEEDGKITLTFQTIIPARLADPLGHSQNDPAVRVISASGTTILEATNNFQKQTNAIPYFLQNRLLIIGEDLAREGIQQVMDYFVRNMQSHPRAWVLIAKGKAANIIKWKSEVNQIPANYIADLLYSSTRQAITAFATADIHRFILALSSQSTSPATSGIEIVQEQDDEPPEVRIFGTAVFKRDKLAGWMGLRETRGMLWITNQSTQGILETGYPALQKRNLVQQVTRAKGRIKPKLNHGKIEAEVEVKEEGNIGEQDGSLKLTGRSMIRALEKNKAAEMRAEIESCLRQCQQEFHSDIFGFGEEIQRKFPQEWKRLGPRWDTEFSHLQIKVRVRAKIRGTGFITDPINLK
ncbi:MAG TPA: Ger(x)C family spore germination protein [Bacillota bacterium]